MAFTPRILLKSPHLVIISDFKIGAKGSSFRDFCKSAKEFFGGSSLVKSHLDSNEIDVVGKTMGSFILMTNAVIVMTLNINLMILLRRNLFSTDFFAFKLSLKSLILFSGSTISKKYI